MMWAICCATAVSAEFKDRILKESHGYYKDDIKKEDFVFVDDLSRTYDTPDEIGKNIDSTSAPFHGKTPHECRLLLSKIREDTGSEDFDDMVFAILDERSLVDGALLLAGEPEEEDAGESKSVRVVFEIVETALVLWLVGKSSPSEDKERADSTEDGVLRQLLGDPVTKDTEDVVSPPETGEYKLHVPDPKDFFPPELRRELLLDTGDRVLLGSRDLEKNWDEEIIWIGGKRARVVRELLGDEKSEPFGPKKSSD